MSHRRSTVKGSLSFANPTVRAWLFQILAVVAVVGIIGWLFHNTVTNLSNRGITSGFAFLDRGAGFGIVQHLIDYQQGDTYGRVFIVGLLNTLLVSALCIVFASVLGFFIGLARLSDNWLLRKLSTIYIEIFRNIPPLLQIFFWYFAVLRNLPATPGSERTGFGVSEQSWALYSVAAAGRWVSCVYPGCCYSYSPFCWAIPL